MRGLLGGRGVRLAAVAVIAAALLSGTPAQAAENIVTMPDPAGDAHAATSLCALDCSGAPTPVSEPSIDVRTARVDRIGGDLVFEWKVVDLDHVPLAQPEDVVGYQLGARVEGVNVLVYAWRTAAHTPLVAEVSVSTDDNRNTRRTITASYDHATNVVGATVPLPVLNDAVDDLCGSCHVDSGSRFERPFVMTYVLATTPFGPTGPVYQDLVRETESTTLIPTSGGVPSFLTGGGPFAGTITWGPPSPECDARFPLPGTVSLTAAVAASNGVSHYAGPLTFEGTGCGGFGDLTDLQWSVHGTDPLGTTLDCPDLPGMALDTIVWAAVSGGPCTLDGRPVDASFSFLGQYVPTGIRPDLTQESGTVAGGVAVVLYEEA